VYFAINNLSGVARSYLLPTYHLRISMPAMDKVWKRFPRSSKNKTVEPQTEPHLQVLDEGVATQEAYTDHPLHQSPVRDRNPYVILQELSNKTVP
jgi:hypothetical protein